MLTLPPLDPTKLSGYVPAPKVETKPKTGVSSPTYNPFAALSELPSSGSSSSGGEPAKKKKKEKADAQISAPTQTTTGSVTKAQSRPKKARSQPASQTPTQAPTQAPTGQVVVNNDISSYVRRTVGFLLVVGTVVSAVWLTRLGYGWPGGSGE